MGRLSDLLNIGSQSRCHGGCRKCGKRCMFDRNHSGSHRCKAAH